MTNEAELKMLCGGVHIAWKLVVSHIPIAIDPSTNKLHKLGRW